MIDSKYSKTLIALLALAGCSSMEQPEERPLLKVTLDEPSTNDGGVVILESFVAGEKSAFTAASDDSDCIEGRGMGVMTSSARGENRFLFNNEGQPCKAARTIFDGKLKKHQRAADPSVNIAFVDKYGKKPEPMVEVLPSFAGDIGEVTPENPEDFALIGQSVAVGEAKDILPLQGEGDAFQQKLADVTSKNMDVEDWDYQKVRHEALAEGSSQKELHETIQKWHEERERQKLVKGAEKLIAGARSLERKSSHELVAEHQKEITKLMARLREAEKMQDFQRERENLLKDQLVSLQSETQALRMNQVQSEAQLQQQVSVMEQRARKYESLAREIQEDKNHSEIMLRKRVSDLRKQLKSAEKVADKNQQKLLLDAAQQLAQAEAAARKVQASKRAQMERQAARKESEAAFLARKAEQINVSSPVILPAFADIASLESPEAKYEKRLVMLEKRINALQAPQYDGSSLEQDGFAGAAVVLKAEDKPLDEIMRQALAQAMPQASWQLKWELSNRNLSIKDEKWTVIAEARMDEILAYVKQKVKSAHDADIEFRRFDDGGLFVISDGAVPIK